MPIDRPAVLARHCPRQDRIDPRSPLQVGNGELAVGVDVTGLQTFASAYPGPDGGSLLGTQAQWGWHTIPWPGPGPEPQVAHTTRTYRTAHGDAAYVDLSVDQWSDPDARATAAEEWLRANPHRLDLGRVGLWRSGGTDVEALRDVDQRLDLPTGVLTSRFTLYGERYEVITCVHPERDVLAVRVCRSGADDGAHPWGLRLTFAYGSPAWGTAQDWNSPTAHSTRWSPAPSSATAAASATAGPASGTVERVLDATRYQVRLAGSGVDIARTGDHEVRLTARGDVLEATFGFRPGNEADGLETETFADVRAACVRWWGDFWSRGAAVDLGGVADDRGPELERRIVLSQYLTAVNGAGSTPPAETGLLTSSWRGKFHLEMHWWHAAHFASWGRPDLLERSLDWYRQVLPAAQRTARAQGLPGARWPKQTDPSGTETPSSIGPFLLWQQPHPIHLAELAYTARPERATLEAWAGVVEATAELMAAVAVRGPHGYGLGPPLIPAQESYAPDRASNADPTFELVYWSWALRTALRWRRRLKLPEPARWRAVADQMRRPVVRDGVYAALAVEPYLVRDDHPSMLAALGVVPDVGLVDQAVMSRTLDSVDADWDWGSTWGWDYPMAAMTAARLGRTDALEWLLRPEAKNTYLANGHNWQGPELPAYLPGNGGLLQAVAVLCGTGAFDAAGWDVVAEGFAPLPT